MVELISGWAKNIVFVVILLSILEMLLPQNKTKKYIKMIMGLFLLFQILSPLIQDKDKISLANWEEIWEGNTLTANANVQVTDQTSMDNRLQQIYQEELEKDIKQKIEEKGYEVTNCQVKTTLKLTGNEQTSKETTSGIEKITLQVKKAESSETNEKTTNNSTNKKQETNETDQNKKSAENILIEEIQNIKKVKIGNSEAKNEQTEKNKTTLSQVDTQNIKKFLMEEYEVKESCLKINGKN